MTKKEIIQQIKDKIKEGKTQQQVYDEISAGSDWNEETLANLVKSIPSHRLKQRNHMVHKILLIVIALVVLYKLINIVLYFWLSQDISIATGLKELLQPAFGIMFLIWCSKYDPKAHFYLGIISSWMVFKLIIHFISNPIDPVMLFIGLLNLLVMILSIYLYQKLVPGYHKSKERYINDHGQERMRYVYEFYDADQEAPR